MTFCHTKSRVTKLLFLKSVLNLLVIPGISLTKANTWNDLLVEGKKVWLWNFGNAWTLRTSENAGRTTKENKGRHIEKIDEWKDAQQICITKEFIIFVCLIVLLPKCLRYPSPFSADGMWDQLGKEWGCLCVNALKHTWRTYLWIEREKYFLGASKNLDTLLWIWSHVVSKLWSFLVVVLPSWVR